MEILLKLLSRLDTNVVFSIGMKKKEVDNCKIIFIIFYKLGVFIFLKNILITIKYFLAGKLLVRNEDYSQVIFG